MGSLQAGFDESLSSLQFHAASALSCAGPGVSQDAALAGLGAAPERELCAQHHGQLPAPRSLAG